MDKRGSRIDFSYLREDEENAAEQSHLLIEAGLEVLLMECFDINWGTDFTFKTQRN